MEISTEKITTLRLDETETAAFKTLIDKVEQHRCNEGGVIRVSIFESNLLADLHNYFFVEPDLSKSIKDFIRSAARR